MLCLHAYLRGTEWTTEIPGRSSTLLRRPRDSPLIGLNDARDDSKELLMD